MRLTGSFYSVKSANSNTLFGENRTGSHYFDVMENASVAEGTTLSNENDYSPFSGRYNTVTAAMQGYSQDITINREVASAGWFLTRNIMLKAEYVNQVYKNYPDTNILNGGKFYGEMLEASIAF